MPKQTRGTRRADGCWGAVTLWATLTCAAAAPATAQDIPRTPSGQPDMNGIWQALGNAHWDLEPHTARAALVMQEGPVVPVPAQEVLAMGAVGSVPSHWGSVVGGSIPYLPDALERKLENQADWANRDPEVKCYLPGVPRGMYMPFPYQIFQSESAFFIAFEYAGAVRNIYLEDPGPPQVDSWMGQSVGHWEGDTFVVRLQRLHRPELVRPRRQPPLVPDGGHRAVHDDDPVPHRLRGDDRGPAHLLSEPWTDSDAAVQERRSENARLGQFKCVEFVEELMYGHLRKNPIGSEEGR